MAKNNKNQSGGAINYKKKRDYAPGNAAESGKKFQLTMYYKVAGLFTIICGILYAVVRVLAAKGYMLINTGTQYWIWYALVIGLLLVIGRYISEKPQTPTTRKAVKISVSIVTICLMLLLYAQCINMIDNGLQKYAVQTSPDGTKNVIIMRDLMTVGDDSATDEEGNTATVDYVTYRAYPQINRFFCDSSKEKDSGENMIWLMDGDKKQVKAVWSTGETIHTLPVEDVNFIWLQQDVENALNGEWSEDGKIFTITASGDVFEAVDDGDEGKKLDTIVVEFE